MGCCWGAPTDEEGESLLSRKHNIVNDGQNYALEIARIKEAKSNCASRLGSPKEAHEFATVLLNTPEAVFDLQLLAKKKIFDEAIQYIDYAITAEASMGGSKWRTNLYLARGDLLLQMGAIEEALTEFKATVKGKVDKQIIEHCFPKYVELGRENEINEVCKEAYSKTKSEEERELLLDGFYRYTTITHKAAYEWANPIEVDKFVEKQKVAGVTRETIQRKKKEARESEYLDSQRGYGGVTGGSRFPHIADLIPSFGSSQSNSNPSSVRNSYHKLESEEKELEKELLKEEEREETWQVHQREREEEEALAKRISAPPPTLTVPPLLPSPPVQGDQRSTSPPPSSETPYKLWKDNNVT